MTDFNSIVFRVRPKDPDHHANMAGWMNFQRVCIGKLNRKRKEGRGGWNDPEECSIEHLEQLLKGHIDRLAHLSFADEALYDISNFAMMIWNRRKMEEDIKPIMPEERDDDDES